MAHDDEYLLGAKDEELRRLGFQHEVWSAETSALFDAAAFGPGEHVVDLGCGPGYASVELARRVASGRVTAVDASPRSLGQLTTRAAALGVEVEARQADVTTLELDAGSVDGVFARWLFCFLPDPAPLVARIATWLKPGGRVALLDYFNYASFSLAPRPACMAAVVEAVVASWSGAGGNLDVGGELPAMLEAHGLRITHLVPRVFCARPGTPRWHWPRTFFRGFLPKLVAEGHLHEADAQAFDDALSAAEHTPGAYLMTPPVISMVATKV